MILTPEEYLKIKHLSEWNDEKNEYKIAPFRFKDNKLNFPKLPL